MDEGRAARPGLQTGVCGEDGGDPESVHFFHDIGLDYVSCSGGSGRAALAGTDRGDSR